MPHLIASRREVLAGASAAFAFVPDLAMAKPAKSAVRSADALARALHAAPPAQSPALSLAVARPGGLVWSGAYGKADLEFGVAATPAHLFRLGSVSKVVTATAAAKLVAR